MFDAKDRIRSWVYGCFPELDGSRSTSWPALVLDQLSLASERVARLVTLLQGSQKRWGTVVLLPPPSFEGPKFMSETVATTRQFHGLASPEEVQVRFPMHWPLGPGAWVVTHGCSLRDVYVGNKSQTTGPEGTYCQITDEAGLGVQLQIRVRFES